MRELITMVLAASLMAGISFELAAQGLPRLDEVTLIDLSHPYDNSTLFWPCPLAIRSA